mmetsp:Transcript_7560/g.11965  ORF Transcript_7560/g.11965 Transcript_7560/m.11965 type:complete len:415 (+) Transcript_7560:1-1245(+)
MTSNSGLSSSSSSSTSGVVRIIKNLFWVFKFMVWDLPFKTARFGNNAVTAVIGVVWKVLVWWATRGRGQWTAHRKTVLLTGASTTIGSETARQLAMEGARLALVSSSSMKGLLEPLADECKELGSSKVEIYSADLGNDTSTKLTLQQVAKDFGGSLDVVILNGQSLGQGCFFEEIQETSDIEQMVKENLLGCVLTLHYALKYVPKSSESRIVVLSSTCGHIGSPFQTLYAATQHALTGFCNSFRMELSQSYARSKAPKVCLVSYPLIAGQYNTSHSQDRMLHMGTTLPPTKTYSWAGIPLQHAVHDLLEAIASGRREFGVPRYVTLWQCLSALLPSCLKEWTVDWAIVREAKRTHYRPLEETTGGMHTKQRMMNHNHSHLHSSSSGAAARAVATARNTCHDATCQKSVSNQTWS